MKKGDIIGRECKVEIGEILATNFNTEARALDYITRHKLSSVARAVPASGDTWNIEVFVPYNYTKEAKVMWIVENEASIEVEPNAYKIINILEEPAWKVIVEATPSYQSSVASLTDDQLRESIEALRNTRIASPKPKAKIKTETVDVNDPLAQFMAGLSEEEKTKLKTKLGMI